MSPQPPPEPTPEPSPEPSPPLPSSLLPPARPRHGLALGLAAASVVPAVVLGSPPAAATPVLPLSVTADQQPTCGTPTAGDFPITTRIHSGPETYASGGGYGTWFLDLTNTTSESCRSIHPVLVLTDEDRKLTSDQIQLEFSDQAQPDVEHRVAWETTDRDEHIGVFGGDGADDFAGFTVPAGRTVTVEVRMAFTSDTGPGRITVNAAIVQRQRGASADSGTMQPKDDGDWVGESDDYVFSVVEDSGDSDTGDFGDTGDYGDTDDFGEASDSGETGETSGVGGNGDVGGAGDVAGGEDPGRDTARDGSGTGPRDNATGAVGGTAAIGGVDGGGGAVGGTPTPPASGRVPDSGRAPASGRVPASGRAPQDRPELAMTGRTSTVPWLTLLTAGSLLLSGAAVVAWSRRLRHVRR
ncbi:hypothetical protein [Streptomyces sp. NPDC005231]|uniref:hypothetical protein n=1 Tax=Streptomyces sp. NPDC005231 TaxID=3157026 RepID=UPI0033BBAF93